jgi:hypothetical protein
MLPTDAKERKDIPIYSGFICYFPDAIAEVAKVSKRGNDQHNPGKPLHWDRSKSSDELDALARHLIDGTFEQPLEEKIEEAAARTWRSLAHLQKLVEVRETVEQMENENSNSQKSAEESIESKRSRLIANGDLINGESTLDRIVRQNREREERGDPYPNVHTQMRELRLKDD